MVSFREEIRYGLWSKGVVNPQTPASSYRTLRKNSNQPSNLPQSIPGTPLAISDIQNGSYQLNGAGALFTDIWTTNAAWDVHDAATIIGGTGWQVTNPHAEDGMVFTAGLFNLIDLSLGCVLVWDFTVTQVSGDALLGAGFNDAGTFFLNEIGFQPPAAFVGAGPPNDYSFPALTSGAHKAATILGPSVCGISLDGGDATTVVGTSISTSTYFGVYLKAGSAPGAQVTLRKLTVYPALDISVLKLLSV